jgi:outer membrane protein assembly factor BamB
MKKLSLLMCVFLMSGCSWMKFWESDDDNEIKPAELEKFEEEVVVRKLWSRGAGSGQDELHSTLKPALSSGGMLYTADGNGRVFAINAGSGKIAWSVNLDKPLSGGVGFGAGLVLVGDLDGRVFALDAASGATLWRKRVKSEVIAAPTTNGSTVIVQTFDSRMLGLDAQTGDELWQFNTDAPILTLRGSSSPVMAGDTVVTGFPNGKIIALNADDGGQLWENRIAVPKGRTELERMVDIYGSPVIVGDVVYATSYQGRVAALSRGTGRALWYQDISSYRQPGFGSDQVFVTQDDDEIKALRANSGQVLWTNSLMTYRKMTAPAYVDGYVAVADSEGYLHVLSARDGHLVGRTRVDGSGVSAPMLTDGSTLYVFDNGGDLSAYQIQSR